MPTWLVEEGLLGPGRDGECYRDPCVPTPTAPARACGIPPFPASHPTPRKPRGGQGKGEPGEAAVRELVPRSLAGGDARAANQAKRRIEVQPRTRRSVRCEDRQTRCEGQSGERTGWRQGPSSPPRTPGALHLSRIRPAAPECGKRGSRAAIKAAPRA